MKSKFYKNYQGPKYPTKAHGKIPAFGSLEEEAGFWDTHNIVDFSPIEDLYQPKKESLILRVNHDMKRKLEKVAKKKKVSVSTLSRIWLAEKLQMS